jgi:ABC-2 type transport system ATP-binding protein
LPQLQALAGVAQVVRFGDTLRISGPDLRRIEATLKQLLPPGCRLEQVPSSLEEVFVHLMRQTKEG